MAAIDAFTNAFTMTSLTAAINKLPYKPQLLGQLGLFTEKPIRTTHVMIEDQRGRLALLPTAARGTVNRVRTRDTRSAMPFIVPHVPYYQTIAADDIQNLRAFGSETELEAMSRYVNEQLMGMRRDHETTHEYHRAGALQGIVLDADGITELFNFFTLFGLVQVEIDFDWNDDSFAPVCSTIIREIANNLGATTFGQIYAICGNDYFDAVVAHPSVQTAWNRWQDSLVLRQSQLGSEWYSILTNGFMYQNIMFINYRGAIGNITFFPDEEAYYTPSGVPDMFQTVVSPANFMETVNTMGQLLYAKQQLMDFDMGVELHTQSNALMINTRPTAVIKSTICNWPGIGSCGSGP